MKPKYLLLALLALFVFPALAQDNTTYTITFDNFSFSYDTSFAARVDASQFTPTDVTQAQFMPPHAQFLFYTDLPSEDVTQVSAPDNFRPELKTEAPGVMRFFKLEDFGEFQQYGVIELLRLLNERPDLTQYMTPNTSLPFLLMVPANQVIRAHAQYVDVGVLSGISYITAYWGGEWTGPFSSNDLVYTFQGITADWQYYVSAIFVLNTDLLVAEGSPAIDTPPSSEGLVQYFADSIALLNNAVPEDFVPSITSLDAMFQSFMVAGAEQPTPSLAVSIGDGEGGMSELIDTSWILVFISGADYGTPANPNVPITLSFTQEGINGIAGCNPYRGALTFENFRLRLVYLETPRMQCAELTMRQEREFLHALQTASSFEIRGNQLHMSHDYGWYTFDPVA